jgi:hypothetical protein
VTVFYRFFIFYVFGNGWIVICNFAFELFVTFLKIAWFISLSIIGYASF